MSREYPDDLRYTKEHEWARIDGNVVTIGVTQFAIESLGDITQIDLPKEGELVKREGVIGTIESVKAVSDVFTPVSGKVVKVNDPLSDEPEMLNDDCYDEGWFVQIEMSNPKELDELMAAEQYEKYLKEQG